MLLHAIANAGILVIGVLVGLVVPVLCIAYCAGYVNLPTRPRVPAPQQSWPHAKPENHSCKDATNGYYQAKLGSLGLLASLGPLASLAYLASLAWFRTPFWAKECRERSLLMGAKTVRPRG